MADLSLNEKFQKLTGIDVIDVEEYIENAEDKKAAFNELQWRVPRGKYTDINISAGKENINEKVKLFADVMTGLASECGVSSDKSDIENIDLNSDNTVDTEDKTAQSGMSEAYAIIDEYNSEDDSEGSSSN